ncbi:GntR family transcriptional regulator [Rathayibacter rathayi]|uniref:GntR family transcriptional regulator n=1 Tax=Rathayibacter rathayi TaxID=33887 RepID=A0ABD6W6C5_RATRA|nr:FCD domain-containing protein [Rathayibacter rathayi]PPF10276.1 GntR family transcriptional regulator [Rathayibacter rathayi]PPF75441.1 GntR family transcriptional regulator [Rathayibacter rathayi]PPG38442.1 GntR family transcriptional regulator [Rathayibacter rathayi]PPG85843.1 GntR family transcriptional regulator [Rathayibacter rathayi]PPG93660.1 GntR family transcriptional regulator [Rathayibacter rathayi]
MVRASLVTTVADAVLDDIVAGVVPIGSELPSEAALAAQHDVSRVTMREALKRLQGLGVLDVRRGKRGVVAPTSAWTDLEPILRVTAFGADPGLTELQLIEVREMIESGAAALAAARCSAKDLAELERMLRRMRTAHEESDVGAFVEADIAFHDVILRATGNVFVGVVLAPLSRVMREKRAQTSAVDAIQAHAIQQHTRVLAALRSGDAEASRTAMSAHMRQTADDFRAHVLPSLH